MIGTEEEAAGRLCPIPFLVSDEHGDPRSERFGCVGSKCQWWMPAWQEFSDEGIALEHSQFGQCAVPAIATRSQSFNE